MKHTLRAGLLGATLTLTAAPLAAQAPMTPRSLGMAGAYTGIARGNEALFFNPANLALPGNPYWSVAFPQVVATGTVVGPGIGDIDAIRNYRNQGQSRRDELLATIPDEGGELGFEARAPLFSLQRGGFGMAVGFVSTGDHTVGRDLVELLFNGYEEGRLDYQVGNTSGRRATYMDVAAAYGHVVGPLSVGVTAHYYHGRGVVRTQLFEPRYDLAGRDIEVHYVGVNSPGGSGYGIDLGAAFQPTPTLTLSASMANAFAHMNWSKDLRVRESTLRKADFDNSDVIDILDRYEQSERNFDAAGESLAVRRTAEGLLEGAVFPATLRAGLGWQPARGTDVGVSVSSKLTEGRLSGGWDRSLGVGVQQKIPLATVRAGYSTNLESGHDAGSLLSGGLSLGVIDLGLGRYRDGAYGGGAREGWVFSFGLSTRTTAGR
jgi:hypothetical protein